MGEFEQFYGGFALFAFIHTVITYRIIQRSYTLKAVISVGGAFVLALTGLYYSYVPPHHYWMIALTTGFVSILTYILLFTIEGEIVRLKIRRNR